MSRIFIGLIILCGTTLSANSFALAPPRDFCQMPGSFAGWVIKCTLTQAGADGLNDYYHTDTLAIGSGAASLNNTVTSDPLTACTEAEIAVCY